MWANAEANRHTNDTLKIHALCARAARLGGGIVYPPVYYCIPALCGADGASRPALNARCRAGSRAGERF